MYSAKRFYRAARNGEVEGVRNFLDNAMPEHKNKALAHAAEHGHILIARMLVEDGAQPRGGCLFTAVRRRHYNMVKLLLDHNVDKDYGAQNGRTALMEGVVRGDDKLVGMLLDAGAKVNELDHKGKSALVLALSGGKPDIAKQLLCSGASARFCGEYLIQFIKSDDTELVELLLRGGANVNLPYQDAAYYPLHVATQYGRTRVVEVMVEIGVDVHQTDKNNRTALNCAVRSGRVEIARILVNNGATAETCEGVVKEAVRNESAELVLLLVQAASRSKTSGEVVLNDAFMEAINTGSEELVQSLLKAGANVNSVYGRGRTMLYHALNRNLLSIAQLLVRYGAEPITCEPLMKKAIIQGDLDTIQLLLSCSADPDAIDESGRPLALLTAVQNQQLEVCLELGGAGANVNYAPPGGITPLMEAAYSGNVEMVDALLSLDANLNIQQEQGNTAIMWAARYGHLDIVQMLIDAEANLDIRNDKGMSVLDCIGRSLPNYLAIWHRVKRHMDNFKYKDVDVSYFPIAATYYKEDSVRVLQKLDRALIDKTVERNDALIQLFGSADVKVNERDRFNRTILMYMSYRGYTGIVQLLLAKEANANIADERGMTALTWATIGQHVDVVQVLFCYSTAVNIPDKLDRTALHHAVRERDSFTAIVLANAGGKLMSKFQLEGALTWASKEGHAFLVHELCKVEVDVNELDDYRASALIWAARKGHVACVMELLRWHADINTVDWHGKTALWYALNEGHDEVVTSLLPGAGLKNINNGAPALCVAARLGKVQHVRTMLERGVDVEWAEPNGTTALMCASLLGCVEIVDMLVKKNADVRRVSKDGETALHLATYADSPEVINALMSEKADIEKRNGNGLTPLLVASQLGKSKALDALLKHDANAMALDEEGTTALDIAIREGVEITDGAAAVAETLIAWGTEGVDVERTANALLARERRTIGR